MSFTVVDRLLWGAGFISGTALLMVLLWRGRWREFPVLTAWFAFVNARTVALFLIYIDNSWRWYTLVYLSGLWVDFALQLWLAIEIARIVLRPTGTWVSDAKGRFVVAGIGGAVIAGLIAWLVSPPAYNVQAAWEIRGDLFTSLVICELFVAMSLTANRLGLGWRSHVMAVGQGLTTWTSIMVMTTALQSFLGTSHYYASLEHIRGMAYLGATCWMSLQLWRDEPERQPISADLRAYILALHQRVEYDLRRLDAPH